QAASLGVARQRPEELPELAHQGRVHGVERVGPIERKPGEMVLAVDGQRLVHAALVRRWARPCQAARSASHHDTATTTAVAAARARCTPRPGAPDDDERDHPGSPPSRMPTTKPQRCAPRWVGGPEPSMPRGAGRAASGSHARPRPRAARRVRTNARPLRSPTAPRTAVEAPIETCGGPWSAAFSALPPAPAATI